ncbi:MULTISPECIES: heavy metal translocating P-type ATPase [unclassified Microbacterium]|uniref:heavy metal translocating P-type ATPase n=1 Tax=unclassified Microbacterium TaxID=2609290 RepID=UPI0023067829|nr:heavy metal translocating P-type ATPase [Microbacterium sp. nov. GSS16]WCD93036.1 heavy metal translocating P-type ATPase [Microbacterium sp. nov. GSS16]
MTSSTATNSHDTTEEHAHGSARWELWFAIAAGITYAAGMIAEYAVGLPLMGLPLVLFIATYFFGGFFTVRTAVSSTLRGKFEVDFLMIVAAIGAALIGKWAEGAVLLFLFSLGHSLEEYAMSRASKSIEALAELAPRSALVRRGDDDPVEVPVEQIAVGDVVVVRPNSRIPSDGFVIAGISAVDQSAVTGESMPIEKEPVADRERAMRTVDTLPAANRVFAGTVNGSGVLEVVVSATAADSTLSKVVELVRTADQAASPTQQFINRFQRWYVPAVILGVAATLMVAMSVFSQPFTDAFYLAMTVLVAASPCALAIATPAAVLAGVARAARAGVLVKGGAPLETLGRVRAMAFDKTGTLTWGNPQVTSVTPVDGVDGSLLVPILVGVESLSDHPLAAAIVRDLAGQVSEAERVEASDLNAVVGRGVRATVDGEIVEVGNLRMFDEQGLALPSSVENAYTEARDSGQTLMIVRHGDRFLGVVGVMDTSRAESAQVLRVLRSANVGQLVMISGDNQRVADAVGREVGVDTAIGELLPEDKVAHITRLAETHRPIAMVGDGVNDAPAMARADIGIAMGAAGSTVALETCDIALMSDDLGRVPFAVRLSRATSRIIRQNLIASLAIVVLLVIATFIGLNIGAVVLIHEGSTLIVVANALRLLGFERGKEHAGIDHEDRPSR